jgi:hypothetical protein
MFINLSILASVICIFSGAIFAQETLEDKLSGMKIADKARIIHGGKKLDSLKTLKITGKTSSINLNANYDVVILFDVANGITRYEEWSKGKLVTASQFTKVEGEYKGWYFFKDDYEEVKPADISKVRSWPAVYTNVLNLRKDTLNSVKVISSQKVFPPQTSTRVIAVYNEKQPDMDVINWIFDENNRLIGDSFSITKSKLKQILCTKFVKSGGILFPSSCISGETIINDSVSFELKAIHVNPKLSKKVWVIPATKK